MEKTYYITTPIYYVNGAPHLGHAYTTIVCDVMARFMRLAGRSVKFMTGTDDHGQKVEQAAQKAGVSPQEFTDQVSEEFRTLAYQLNCQVDDYMRTTQERHKRAVTHLWELLAAKGDIYLGKYAGWYAVRDEAFYAESELIDGKAPTGAEVEWIEEPSYFFRLSHWEKPLLDYYEAHPEFIWPKGRRNEVLSFVKGGLKDLSISRTSFKWGIPVPNDPAHVMYVWFDALTNYLTGAGYPDDISSLWPADVHAMGKDILRFHAVYWPAFLLAADLPLPKTILAHGWWVVNNEKMSKSVGNVVNPINLAQKIGVDQLRYFLASEKPLSGDGSISGDSVLKRLNAHLSNDLGNLVQRVLSMVHKNCDGQLPPPGALTDADERLLSQADHLLPKLRDAMEAYDLQGYCDHIWQLVGEGNRYVDEQAPWALRKTDIERMNTVLYVLTDIIRRLGIVLQPLMPATMDQLLSFLQIAPDARTFAHLDRTHMLAQGTPIAAPTPLFPRIEEELDVCG